MSSNKEAMDEGNDNNTKAQQPIDTGDADNNNGAGNSTAANDAASTTDKPAIMIDEQPKKSNRASTRVGASIPKEYGEGNSSSSSQADSDEEDQEKRTNYYLQRSGRITGEGCLVPKNKPHQAINGLYKRPRGRQPINMDWDDTRGVWIPQAGGGPNANLVAVGGGFGQQRPRGRNPEGMEWNPERGEWIPMVEAVKPTILVPEKRPRKGIDGSYLRPIGVVPKGYKWDAGRGVWVRPATAGIKKDIPESKGSSETTGKKVDAAPKKDANGAKDHPAATAPEEAAVEEEESAVPETQQDKDEDTTPTHANGTSSRERESIVVPVPQRASHASAKRQKLDADGGFSPNSKWQEPVRRVDDLTLFEFNRKPRRVITGRIQRPVKSFSNLKCVICLGFIKNARVVMECMHRFCEECIEKSLRMGRNECPICRTFVPSRRSLNPDPAFDHLIESILGDAVPEEADAAEEEEDTAAVLTLQRAIFEKKKAGVADRNKRGERSPVRAVVRSPTRVKGRSIPIVELRLKKHQHEKQADKLELSFLRLAGNATVGTLKTFLCQKLDRPFWVFHIYTTLGEKESILNDWTTLEAAATEQLKHTTTAGYPTFSYKVKKI